MKKNSVNRYLKMINISFFLFTLSVIISLILLVFRKVLQVNINNLLFYTTVPLMLILAFLILFLKIKINQIKTNNTNKIKANKELVKFYLGEYNYQAGATLIRLNEDPSLGINQSSIFKNNILEFNYKGSKYSVSNIESKDGIKDTFKGVYLTKKGLQELQGYTVYIRTDNMLNNEEELPEILKRKEIHLYDSLSKKHDNITINAFSFKKELVVEELLYKISNFYDKYKKEVSIFIDGGKINFAMKDYTLFSINEGKEIEKDFEIIKEIINIVEEIS